MQFIEIQPCAADKKLRPHEEDLLGNKWPRELESRVPKASFYIQSADSRRHTAGTRYCFKAGHSLAARALPPAQRLRSSLPLIHAVNRAQQLAQQNMRALRKDPAGITCSAQSLCNCLDFSRFGIEDRGWFEIRHRLWNGCASSHTIIECRPSSVSLALKCFAPCETWKIERFQTKRRNRLAASHRSSRCVLLSL
jgi:hypothetical protein